MKADLLGSAASDLRTAVMASPRVFAHTLPLEAVAVSVAVGLAADVLACQAVIRGVADAFLYDTEPAIVAIVLAPRRVSCHFVFFSSILYDNEYLLNFDLLFYAHFHL